jgi:AraC-like DNA-binding protein
MGESIRPTHGALGWPAAMIVWGPGFTAAMHSHHCVQLVMAMQGTLLVRSARADKWRRCGAALIRPDAFHEIDARVGTVLIAFVDPESELGAALSDRIDGNILCITARQVERWRSALRPELSGARVDRWLRTQVLDQRRTLNLHPRVYRVLKYLRQRRGAPDDVSLKTLAEISGLSQSRFMHVFTESVRVPLRRYILWLRLQRAACELMGGVTVTKAAHSAGFSDAAHLDRTFRRMLGATPTDLALRKRTSRGVSMLLEPDLLDPTIIRPAFTQASSVDLD